MVGLARRSLAEGGHQRGTLMIYFTCPACGKKWTCPDHLAGTTGACSACGTSIRVPSPSPVRGATRASGPQSPLLASFHQIQWGQCLATGAAWVWRGIANLATGANWAWRRIGNLAPVAGCVWPRMARSRLTKWLIA